MISIRQLVIVALVIGVFWLLGRLRRRLTERPFKRKRREAVFKETRRCERCGVYLPRTEHTANPGEGHSCNDRKCPVRHNDFRG